MNSCQLDIQTVIARGEACGPMRSLQFIENGFAVAVGTGLQAYCTDDLRHWQHASVYSVPGDVLTELSLESVASFSRQEIYGVGWNGRMFCCNGTSWQPIDELTNVDLYRVLCARDGFVYACGDEGMLVKGRNNVWHVIEQDVTRENLWDIAFHDGRLYVSTMHLLYKLIGDKFLQIEPPEHGQFPSSTYRLSSGGDLLWSVGTNELYEHNVGQSIRLLNLFS